MKKILYIHHGWGIGGAPISLLNLIKNLNTDLFEISVLFLRSSDVVKLFDDEGVNFKVLDGYFYRKIYRYFQHTESKNLKFYEFHKWFLVILSWLLNIFYFAPSILKSLNPDIIHLNSSVLLDWCIVARNQKAKVIMHIREPISSGTFGIRKYIILSIINKYVDRIIAISKDNAQRLNLPSKTIIVYNPINIPIENKEQTKTTNHSIVYVGGDHKIKGIEIINELIPYLAEDIDIRLIGYYPGNFKKIKNNVKIIGLLDATKLSHELASADILIVPNTKPHFSRPIIESYASKTPVIASRIDGMDEIVFDGITGFLVDPDALSFANKIHEIIRDKEKLRELGEEGYKFACTYFDAIQSAKQVETIYNSLI